MSPSFSPSARRPPFAPPAPSTGRPRLDAPSDAAAFRSAIVIDAATGRVLFEDKADVQNPPASVTKLMTFLIVAEKIKQGELTPDTPVTVTAEAARTGGSQVWLVDKEQIKLDEILYALMVQSANDAATALAIQVAGSKEAFVELMNAKARELGMTHTEFRSPHGLPPAAARMPICQRRGISPPSPATSCPRPTSCATRRPASTNSGTRTARSTS